MDTWLHWNNLLLLQRALVGQVGSGKTGDLWLVNNKDTNLDSRCVTTNRNKHGLKTSAQCNHTDSWKNVYAIKSSAGMMSLHCHFTQMFPLKCSYSEPRVLKHVTNSALIKATLCCSICLGVVFKSYVYSCSTFWSWVFCWFVFIYYASSYTFSITSTLCCSTFVWSVWQWSFRDVQNTEN